jgi:tol-pal system protein YbgF
LNRILSIILVVTCAGIIVGCATGRQVRELDDNINKMRFDQKDMQIAIERLDSLYRAEADASLKLRAEIRSSNSDLMRQFEIMRANLDDMQTMIAGVGSQTPRVVITDPVEDSTGDTLRTPVIPGIDCQELYDESFINVTRGQYEEAIQGFADYLNYCGSQDLADDSRFWTGECYYFMGKFSEAISEFDLLLKDFPDAEKRPGALYKTARSYEELGRKNEAKRTFQQLIDEFPETLEAEQAKGKLKEF